ncbi:hypothetical protein LJK88_01325 [Paenibacillus sp. P26]|nr:hypothetical protein LJK88_01325 [Paenibacillus sp. P26]
MAAECGEMFGNGIFQYWVETMKDRRHAVAKLQKQFVLGAHKLLHADEILQKQEVWLYSSVPSPLVEPLGFRPVNDFQETVNQLAGHQGVSAAVIPYGALTFPIKS